MDRNLLYLVIALLVVVVAVLSYQHYVDQKRGLHITIGPNGASVEGH